MKRNVYNLLAKPSVSHAIKHQMGLSHILVGKQKLEIWIKTMIPSNSFVLICKMVILYNLPIALVITTYWWLHISTRSWLSNTQCIIEYTTFNKMIFFFVRFNFERERGKTNGKRVHFALVLFLTGNILKSIETKTNIYHVKNFLKFQP